MYYIVDKGEDEKKQKLFNQSCKVQITLLVIYGIGGGYTRTYKHTHTRTYKHTTHVHTNTPHTYIQTHHTRTYKHTTHVHTNTPHTQTYQCPHVRDFRKPVYRKKLVHHKMPVYYSTPGIDTYTYTELVFDSWNCL